MGRLIGAAEQLQLLSADDAGTLRELQSLRNVSVHINELVYGRRAGPLVRRALGIAMRVRSIPEDASSRTRVDSS